MITPGPWEKAQCEKGIAFDEEWAIYPPLGESGPVALVSSEEDAHAIAGLPNLLELLERAHAAIVNAREFHGLEALELEAQLEAFIVGSDNRGTEK